MRLLGAIALLTLTIFSAADDRQEARRETARDRVSARRLPGNPIVTPRSDPSIGTNINGPSLIRVPDWVRQPLGQYYLYFADHNGKYIRLAYSSRIEGPWKVYAPGTLQLSQSFFSDHIASPDAVVDVTSHKIRLYYHGLTPADCTQHTRVALSNDGIHFEALEPPVGRGSAYWRIFHHAGWWYALGMPGQLFRSRDGLAGFEAGPMLFSSASSQVHSGLLTRGDTLDVFYTRAGDTPERILYSQVSLAGEWKLWRPTDPEECLAPKESWEGADLPLTAGRIGAVNTPIRALRDPAVFEDRGRTYLLYAVAGESGIAIAELTLRATR